ncbi:MAG: SRPBCC family protein [Deltaproteobacteria bacterium]|nr:SRPBCC family protein [Deltaproteobacteria bacterium]
MIAALLFAVAAEARDWPSADIVNEGTVAASPEAMVAVLTDLARVGTLLPRDCVGQWTPGVPASGAGATAEVRYDMAAMHRKLNMTVTRVEADAGRALVDWDHAGNKGFVTRWTVTAAEGGSAVKLASPLNPPPWPFTKYYFDAVKPEWDACQAKFIAAVGKAAGG